MRVLITGGGGYIGSHTTRLLKENGFMPIVLDNLSGSRREIVEDILEVPLIIGDIGDKDLLMEIISGKHISLKKYSSKPIRTEAIIHFAAFSIVSESISNPLKYYENNFSQSLNLLKVLSDRQFLEENFFQSPIPLIFSSSCSTYGIPKQLPIDESHSLIPISPYGKSKFYIENAIQDLNKSCGMTNFILRYFNAAGASHDSLLGENHFPESHLIPLVIQAALDKKEFFIYGDDYDTPDGTCIRDFVHVDDLANAHLLALKNIFDKKFCNKSNIYNIGIGKGFSVREIITAVEKITKLKVNTVVKSRRLGDPAALYASAERIKRDLGWNPIFSSLDNIVEDALNWQKKLKNLF